MMFLNTKTENGLTGQHTNGVWDTETRRTQVTIQVAYEAWAYGDSFQLSIYHWSQGELTDDDVLRIARNAKAQYRIWHWLTMDAKSEITIQGAPWEYGDIQDGKLHAKAQDATDGSPF
jgi:hypothetical protein